MRNIIENNTIKIRSIIKRFVGTPNEDLEQEIFLKVWKRLDTYKEQNKFSKWIGAVAANVCKDFLKSKSHKIETLQDCSEASEIALNNTQSKQQPEKILDSKLRQKLILKAVNNLPKKMKEVVILYEFEEYSYEEISKKLKIPQGTIKSRLYNARKLLAEQLQELIGD